MPLVGLAVLSLSAAACSSNEDDDASTAAPASAEAAAATEAAEEHDEDSSDLVSAEVSDTLAIEMREFEFAPAALEVEAGEVLEIAFTNSGATIHDFTIDEADLDMAMVGEMDMVEGPGDEEHAGGLALHVPLDPSHDARMRVRLHEPGEYVFYCSVPGHRDLGMVGTDRAAAGTSLAQSDE